MRTTVDPKTAVKRVRTGDRVKSSCVRCVRQNAKRRPKPSASRFVPSANPFRARDKTGFPRPCERDVRFETEGLAVKLRTGRSAHSFAAVDLMFGDTREMV